MDLLDRIAVPARDLLARVDGALLAGGAPADHPIWPLLCRVGALPGELVAQLTDAPTGQLRSSADLLREYRRSYVDGVDTMPGAAGWRGRAADAFGAQWRSLATHLADGPDSMAGRLLDTVSFVDDVAAWLSATRDAVGAAVVECLGSVEAVAIRGLPVGAAGPDVVGFAGARLGAASGGVGIAGASPGVDSRGTGGADSRGTGGAHSRGIGGADSRGIGGADSRGMGGAGAGGVGAGAVGARDGAVRAAATIGAHVLRAAVQALDDGEAVLARWDGHLDELPYRPAPAAADPVPMSGHLTLPS